MSDPAAATAVQPPHSPTMANGSSADVAPLMDDPQERILHPKWSPEVRLFSRLESTVFNTLQNSRSGAMPYIFLQLIVLSYCLSWLGAYTCTQVAIHAKYAATATAQWWWTFLGSVVFGFSAIWCMHFGQSSPAFSFLYILSN